MLHRLQLTVNQMHPVGQAVQADWMMLGPETVAPQSSQGSQGAGDTSGVKADNHKVTSRPQDALHLPQAPMGVLAEVQGVERHDHIDAFTVEGQFIAVAKQGWRSQTAIAGHDLMIDRAAGNQVLFRQRTKLEYVIAESQIEDRLQAVAEGTDEIVPAVSRVQRFQRQGNVARLRARFGFHVARE